MRKDIEDSLGWLVAGAVLGAIMGIAATGSLVVTLFLAMMGAAVTTVFAKVLGAMMGWDR